jgi:adenylate cyclase
MHGASINLAHEQSRDIHRIPTAASGMPAAEAVRLQLERIATSPEFKGSERLRNFLRFIVEETLSGRAERIKGYAIALAVFNRDETFDPQTDPIVRIEAGRLRRSLERYYFMTGRSDPIRIEIPKGGYVPRFAPLESEPIAEAAPPPDAAPEPAARAASPPRGFLIEWAGRAVSKRSAVELLAGLLALVAVAISVAVWSAMREPNVEATTAEPAVPSQPVATGPSVIVLPFADLEEGKASKTFARGVTEELISELTRFRELFVYAPGTAFGYGSAIDVAAVRHDLGVEVEYVLTGSVRREGNRIRIGAQLLNAETGALVWADTYERDLAAASIFDVQIAIARRIAMEIAQPYGAIAAFDWQRVRGQAPESLAAYECVLQAYDYRRLMTLASLPAVRACLERAVQAEPEYADAWAMLALAYADENRYQPRMQGARSDLDRALRAAKRAVDLAPESAHAYRALMTALFLRQQVDEAFHAGERALALNPNSSEVLAELGLRHVTAGNGARGLALIRQAMARNPVPPDWYRVALALGLYRTGAYAEAAREAAKTQPRPGFVYWAVVTAAYARAGRLAEAKQAAGTLLRIYPAFAEHAWAEMAKRNFDLEFAARMVEGWRRAGLDVPAVRP